MATRFLALAIAGTLGLGAPAHSAEYPGPAAQLGPQFFYVWTEEECQTAEMALTDEKAVPWKNLLEGNAELQQRKTAIIAKLHAPGVIWAGAGFRRHVQLTLPEQILTCFALTRYYCRWEDQDIDVRTCEKLNTDSQQLFEQVRNPSISTFGGHPVVPPPWTILQAAVGYLS
jgi:hypothetical protein